MPKYWVGGSGNTSDTAHWSDTDGGAGGATVPTSTDDVFFTSLSHTTDYTVNVDATFTCRDLTFAAPASGNVTRAGSAATDCYGSFTLYSTIVNTYTGITTFRSTSMGNIVTTAGVTIAGQWRFNGAGGGWVLGGALTHTGMNILFDTGTFDTGGYTVTCNIFNSNNSNARTMYLRGSSINLVGTGTTWNFTTTTNLTFDAGTSTITMTQASGTATLFAGDALTYNHVVLAGDNIRYSGSWTCQNLAVNTAGYATGLRATAGTNITVRGAFTTNGFAANLAKISSLTNGTPYTLTKTNGMVSVDYMSIRDCTAAGGNGWYAGANSTNVSGNTGWVFTAPADWTGISAIGAVSQAALSQRNGVSKTLMASRTGVTV